MRTVSAQAHNVRNALAAARRLLGLDLKASREVLRSGGEDGLFRCHLATGDIVEVTTKRHARAEAYILDEAA